jgi:hexokinase
MSCVKETGDVHAQEMIVNTEWGAFDAHDKCLLPYTRFDNRLDRESENARLQVFEKMISGRYLGEVVRLILLEAIDRMILFGGHSSEAMDTPYRFDTAYVSKCVLDNSNDLNEVASLFEHTLGVGESRTSLDERRHIQHICKMAIERAALLSSAALSALLLKRRDLFADGNKVGVGADGSVYEHLPGFVDHMKHGLHTIMGDLAHQVFFVLAKDGSGIGAALTALVASKA